MPARAKRNRRPPEKFLVPLVAGNLWQGHKVKIGIFFDECWKFNFRLLWNCTDKDLCDYLEQEFKVKQEPVVVWAGRFRLLVHPKGGVVLVVALKKWDGTVDSHSLLAHECLHATSFLLRRKGVTLGEDAEETYCYLLESIVRRCLTIIESAKPRKGKAA